MDQQHIQCERTLVADRFALLERDGRAIDLATGFPAWVTIEAAGSRSEQVAWQIRCDARYRLRHPTRSSLIDYGLVGQAQRFEAWSDAKRSRDDEAPGLMLIPRPAVHALAEMFRPADERRPRVAALWGAHGSGTGVAALTLAREARLNGFVPISASLVNAYGAWIAGRTLFVIDRTERRCDLSAFFGATVRNPRPHMLLIVGREEHRRIDSLAIGRVTTDALVGAVRPGPTSAEASRRLRVVAERADGLPARFAEALWPVARPRAGSSPTSRVAERSAVYGIDGGEAGSDRSLDPTPAGRVVLDPAVTEPAIRQRIATAEALLDAGRHVPGIRLLRQSVGSLARRHAWVNAADGAMRLGSELLRRGRARDSIRVLEDAAEYASRGQNRGLAFEIGTLVGDAWIDLTRLDEAERVLTATLAAARQAGDRWHASATATALARCLFWRGEYADAEAALNADNAELAGSPCTVRRLRMKARLSAALGKTHEAIEAVESARGHAARSGDRRLLGDVDATSAFVRFRIGDLDGVDRDASAAIAAARQGRRPMRAFASRLIRAESDRHRGRKLTAAETLQFQRLSKTVPPLLRARWQLFAAMVAAADPVAESARHVAVSGLKALTLFALAPSSPTRAGSDPFVDEMLAILHVCQTAEDEVALLSDVCGRVRRHVHAATVAFAGQVDRGLDTVASDGPRIDFEVGVRAYETGITIAPHRVRERLEAAAPVHYGGTAIGALCARWSPGLTNELCRVPGILSMAATAAAPLVAAALAKRKVPASHAGVELLGVTPAITDLRREVERAAAAPFPVLIEGESGSGKELVARAIHRCGPRRDRPFSTLNCAALPDDLVEAELFGHARGAFTGAVADRAGVFEEAHGGTLFLDEVGELSARAQAKLLRVIQEGELRRIGENTTRRIDVRIVAATNRDLRREVETGRFRMDLLYRLDVIRISVPPLRTRREDITVLVDHFWADATRRVNSRAVLASSTRGALAGYDWPGNVRELQNVLAALAVRTPKRGVVAPAALPPHVAGSRPTNAFRLDTARRIFEASFVRAALVRAGGSRSRAAIELGVTRQGLSKLMARLGIQ